MEVQNTIYSSSRPPFESLFFSPYNTPPYITTYWPNDINALEEAKHFQQMQHIRFPTPPITPPRLASQYASEAAQQAISNQRTESVIMKVEQGKQSAHIVRAEIYPIDEHKLSDCSGNSSSSATASPSTDFVCNWIECGRYFDCLDALAQHVTQQHAIASIADGLYYCRWSGCLRSERGFNARYKMLVHVRTHTKEKPHQCHLCEKSFSRAENLKIHIRSHSGEKPYKCTFDGCQKAYSNSSDRFKHTRTHSMEKPYMCKVAGCQKRYTDPSSLRKHVKTFKHGEQLIPSPINSANAVSLQKQRLFETEGPFICDVASAAQYYINVASDFKVNQIDYTPHYWLPSADSSKNPAHNYTSNDYTEDMIMETELNAPLDLRVNRG